MWPTHTCLEQACPDGALVWVTVLHNLGILSQNLICYIYIIPYSTRKCWRNTFSVICLYSASNSDVFFSLPENQCFLLCSFLLPVTSFALLTEWVSGGIKCYNVSGNPCKMQLVIGQASENNLFFLLNFLDKYLREHLLKKNVFFGALPELPLPPTPPLLSGNLYIFFGRQKGIYRVFQKECQK